MRRALLNIALGATLIFELVSIVFVVVFWKNLQVAFHIGEELVRIKRERRRKK